MAKITLAIDTGFYQSASLPLADQRCVNLYPQNPQTKGALSPGSLFSPPGISEFSSLTGTTRGFWTYKHELYAVNGTRLYRIMSDGTSVDIGQITGSGPVSMATNGDTLVIIVPGGDGYFYTKADGYAKITDATFKGYQAEEGGVLSVTFQDGYFAYITKTLIFLGSLATDNRGRDFDALQFATAEIKPDDNVRILSINNELYVFGETTIEVFQNIGGSGFPFSRIPGATIDRGLSAMSGVTEYDNSFIFLGAGEYEAVSIWQGYGGGSTKISTAAIDAKINTYTRTQLEAVEVFKYARDGNFFVCFIFPDITYEYNSTASAMQQRPVWHERSTGGSAWRVNNAIQVYGRTILGDKLTAKLGYFDSSLFTEYGSAVERTFTGSYFENKGKPLFVSSVELYCETGVGEYFTTNVDPKIKLEYSDDGARTFKNAGEKSIGKAGNYTQRLIWRSLGRVAYSRVLRFSITTGAKVNMLQLQAEVHA